MSQLEAEPYPAEKPLFKAELFPHRSLPRRGFLIVMGLLAGAWGLIGLGLFSLGAWPVLGFFGLDLLLVYLAFRLSYRSGRAREEVEVSRTELKIRKVAPSGRSVTHRMNPFWARFRVGRHPEIGITHMVVEGREATVPVGGFLNPDDRESFAQAFGQALKAAKAG